MGKKIGRYHLGIRDVDVYGRKGTGGEFFSASESNGIAEIHIGLSDKPWPGIVNALLHEAMELTLSDMRCRWRPTPDYSNDHSNYFFVATHEQFSEALGRVAYFLSESLPELAKVYKRSGGKT